MSDIPGASEAAPRRRSPPPDASAPAFAQQIAAFYPYPNPQDPAVRAAAETPSDKRAGAAAATARPASLMRRRGGREPG